MPESRKDTPTPIIRSGFALVIVLLFALASLGVVYVNRISKNLHRVVNEENNHIDLIHKMLNASRARLILLSSMVVTPDPFQRDEQFMRLRDQGAAFIEAYERLLVSNLEESERLLLDEHNQLAVRIAEDQYRVIDLVQMDRLDDAVQHLLYSVYPRYTQATDLMDGFLEMQKNQNKEALEQAAAGFRQGYVLMIILGVSALGVTGSIATGVRRRIGGIMDHLDHAREELQRANEELEHRVEQRTVELQAANVSLQREVAERQQAQADLANSEVRYRSFVEHFSGIAFQADMDLRLIFLHGAVEEITGLTERDFIDGGVSWRQIVSPDDLGALEPSLRKLTDTPDFRFEAEFRVCHQNGETHYVRGIVQNVCGRSGKPILVEGTLYDVTERKRTEQALLKSEALLREQARQLAEADRRKDEFLAMLGHELRNPLAPIRNAVELMKMQRISGQDMDRIVEMIDRQSMHMSRLVDDLLSVARITRGRFELRRERISMTEVIQHAVETVRPLIAARKHKLRTSLPPETVEVHGDATRLTQVLVNLLNNAARYTPPGGAISIRVERKAKEVSIAIRDTGIGLPAELLSGIFEPFRQETRSLERGQGGLGLGLTLAKKLTEMHGGRVEAHSAGRGFGSEFVVHLPLAGAVLLSDAQAESKSPRTAPLRVLIVEDNRDVASSFEMLVSTMGHQVRAVYDGHSALMVMNDFRPVVIFLDIGLPGMDGYELARRLRHEHGRSICLIALTGYGQEDDLRRMREVGIDHHLLKPATIDSLERLLSLANEAQRTV